MKNNLFRSVIGVAVLFAVACNPYKMIVDTVVDVVHLAEEVVWFGIYVSDQVKQRGVVRIEVTHDGDLSVVRAYNDKGQVVFDSAMSGVEAPATLRCGDADLRLDDAFVNLNECSTSCDDERLLLHVTAREVEACHSR